jgi:hypothetical protein
MSRGGMAPNHRFQPTLTPLGRFSHRTVPAAAERLSEHCPVVVDIQDRDLDRRGEG